MPWFSLIADGSRSRDRLPAISGEWSKPSSRASPSFRGLTHSPERPEQPKQLEQSSQLELMRNNDNYKNKARRRTKNREF